MIRQYNGLADLLEPRPWTVHGRRQLYDSRWVSLELVDVEPIGGDRYEHHVVIIPYEAVCVVVHHPERGVLLLYRHRFITDTAGFELPAGGIAQGESVVDAAAREVLEETGWAITAPKAFMRANASDGVSNQKFNFVYAVAEKEVGKPVDQYESQQLYWVPKEELPSLIKNGLVPGCSAMSGLLYALNFGYLGSVGT